MFVIVSVFVYFFLKSKNTSKRTIDVCNKNNSNIIYANGLPYCIMDKELCKKLNGHRFSSGGGGLGLALPTCRF
jgi:hypothetical protein